MDPKTAHLYLLALNGLFMEPGRRTLLSAEPDAGTGGGGDGKTPPTPPANDPAVEKRFTQADLEAAIDKRLKATRNELEATKATAAKAAELEKKLEELTHTLETKGKPEDEKKRIEQEREFKRIQAALEGTTKERDNEKARAEKALSELTSYMVTSKLSDGLGAAKALPTAMSQAVKLMSLEGNARLEDGKVVVTVGGLDFVDDAKGAAAAWLKMNPHFATAQGGTGTGSSKGPPGDQAVKLGDLGVEDLLRTGLRVGGTT